MKQGMNSSSATVPTATVAVPTLVDHHLPMREAMATCYSMVLEDGFAALDQAASTAKASVKIRLRRLDLGLALGIPSAMMAAVMMLSDITGIMPQPIWAFIVELVIFILPFALTLRFQAWQYGSGFPTAPLALPHVADKQIDALLAEFQREGGPKVYRQRTDGRYAPVNRRLFFGRLRYLLLSQNSQDHRWVSPFGRLLPEVGDLFVTHTDLERLRLATKPKRKPGSGRDIKYAYTDAVIAVMADQAFHRLDLSNEARATDAIIDDLLDWFKDNMSASGDIPSESSIRPYAKKIIEALSEKNVRRASKP